MCDLSTSVYQNPDTRNSRPRTPQRLPGHTSGCKVPGSPSPTQPSVRTLTAIVTHSRLPIPHAVGAALPHRGAPQHEAVLTLEAQVAAHRVGPEPWGIHAILKGNRGWTANIWRERGMGIWGWTGNTWAGHQVGAVGRFARRQRASPLTVCVLGWCPCNWVSTGDFTQLNLTR